MILEEDRQKSQEKEREYLDYCRSIAYCGLICHCCSRASRCRGCRQGDSLCGLDLSSVGCYQKQCCIIKGLAGCWECDNLYACQEGMYQPSRSAKPKAFSICIREDGKKKFISYILTNQRTGLRPEKGGDYDGKPMEIVLTMIRGENI